MKSILSLVAGSVLFGASQVAAYGASNPGAVVYKGCYSSSTGLQLNSTYTFNTQGYCQKQCAPLGYQTLATAASTDCYCGNELPPASSLVSDSNCNAPCAGYGTDMCGGASGFFSVWLSGVSISASAAPDSSTSSSTSPTSTGSTGASQTTASKPSVVTAAGSTVVITAPADASGSASASAKSSSSSGGPSKTGIAVGVVVGIVAFSAIAGGIFLFIRNRKRRQVEEEYRRNAAVSSFIGGGKPPTSSGGDSAFTDLRLDPAVMAQRRMSDGSIADNQDYSRRILKVTNA